MGCSASKEVSSSTVASSSAPPAAARQQQQQQARESAVTTTTTTSNNKSSTASKSKPPLAAGGGGPATAAANRASAAANMTPQEAAELGQMMVQLNDVVPGSQRGGAANRGRFESYASGASTPNTSSGNISWSGDSDKSGQGNEASGETTGSDSKRKSSKRNPRSLKHSHSGSAIDLENLHKDASCTLTSKVVHIEVPFGKPIEEVYDGVHNGPVLGSGVSGIVRLATHKKTGVEYAVKCLDLGLVGTKEGLEQLREEIFIMCQLDHPNIVRLEEVYESHSEIYLVQELCVGGELFDRLDEQPDYHYTEAECARLVKQMLSAVRYLHSKGIIHRDLKLENFLFSSKAPDSELKMIDFGLSKHFRFGEVHHEAVGTPYTVAPEVIKGSYDERCDIWAIGVITFLLFSGDPPFGGCGGPEPLLQVRQNILSCDYEFEPSDIWDLVSDHGKGFVKSLLVVDPKNRPTAREAQKHPWLKHWASRDSEGNHQDNVLNPNVVKALVNFKEFSDMQKLLSEVLSFTLLPDQIKDLRKEFEIMDTDGSGEISLQALKTVLVSNAVAGSLGALTEEEVEDIFDAMRVNKADTRIHWHEFIAAGLSQCQVDDRNLRLAFDRLDGDHKGYITLDDIFKLVGDDELHNENQMRSMWTESMRNLNCTQRHITYDNFLLLMKGQTQEPEGLERRKSTHIIQQQLHSLPENAEVDGDRIISVENGGEIGEAISTDDEAGKVPARDGSDVDLDHFVPRPSLEESSCNSLPNMGANPMFESSGSISPSPTGQKSLSTVEFEVNSMIPNLGAISKPSIVTRRRSKSLESETLEDIEAAAEPATGKVRAGDRRLALSLPEHCAKDTIKDDLANKSALAMNRQLYRGHRQIRISFLDACKRFEEQQASRARDTLMKEQVKEAMGAGLVMRHGTKFQVTSEAIRKYLDEAQAEQQVLLDKANRRGGRGRSARKKTISDMSAMMNPSMGQDELGDVATRALAKTPEANREIMNNSFSAVHDMPDLSISGMGDGKAKLAFKPTSMTGGGSDHNKKPEDVLPPNLPEVDHVSVRKATVPGKFHKTQDPFSIQGMYGGARLQNEAISQIQSPSHPISSRRHATQPP